MLIYSPRAQGVCQDYQSYGREVSRRCRCAPKVDYCIRFVDMAEHHRQFVACMRSEINQVPGYQVALVSEKTTVNTLGPDDLVCNITHPGVLHRLPGRSGLFAPSRISEKPPRFSDKILLFRMKLGRLALLRQRWPAGSRPCYHHRQADFIAFANEILPPLLSTYNFQRKTVSTFPQSCLTGRSPIRSTPSWSDRWLTQPAVKA